jgi:CheY-like chemotaxis protein
MKILIVDDTDLKIAKIKTVIIETAKLPEFLVAKNKADAMTLIMSNPLIDLMILDLNLPNRSGENAKRLAGLSFLKELNRRDSIVKPDHIIGLTAYSELKNEVRDEFEQNGWVIITYNTANAEWEETIKNKIDYISSNISNNNNNNNNPSDDTSIGLPKRRKKEQISNNWIASSAIVGLSAMIVTGILLYFPFNLITASILIGVCVFILMLFKNPKYFYRRMLSYLIGSFIILVSMPLIEFQHYFLEDSFAKFAAQNIDKWFYIVMAIISLALILADLKVNGREKINN